VDQAKIEAGVRLVLEGIGEDPGRPGLRDTPRRVAEMCADIFSGIGADPRELLITMPGDQHQEMVLVKDIAFYSICEHHLLPFVGTAHVAYIPGHAGRIAGLSKLARVVRLVAARPQLQERITSTVADAMMDSLEPLGVLVQIEAEHLCMSMRGVRTPGAKTVTSAVRGMMESSVATRAEVFSLINEGR
jgi:GTP cyclohydrolase IA